MTPESSENPMIYGTRYYIKSDRDDSKFMTWWLWNLKPYLTYSWSPAEFWFAPGDGNWKYGQPIKSGDKIMIGTKGKFNEDLYATVTEGWIQLDWYVKFEARFVFSIKGVRDGNVLLGDPFILGRDSESKVITTDKNSTEYLILAPSSSSGIVWKARTPYAVAAPSGPPEGTEPSY